MIPRETIDRIYEAAKIEDIVGDYVKLHKRGANLIGLCPFHNEKTGSFTVSPSKGIYKCFGCGASGHAVKFVQEIEQCSYADALKQVAKRYHIEVEERQLTPEEQQRQDNRESMFAVNEFANTWFQQQLWDTEEGRAVGLGYFHERGLTDDIIRKYQLGYSPEKGSPLAKALKKQGFRDEYILNDVDTKVGTGICGRGQQDDRLYDRFRDRVIFPIHSVSGKIVGFAGRILKKKDNVGKYVNSPDSIIYSKTRELYGIYIAKQAISRADLCYLVEGQMDVISMHQAGIENVVASGGTALTKQQILLIKRFTSNITVLYDGDAAGIHAALRGIDMFLSEGFNVKVLLLPDGEDPDSFARSHNASDFIEYIRKNQTDFIRFKINLLRTEMGDDPQKRAALIKDITLSIAQIPDRITRQVYISDAAERMQIGEKLLLGEVLKQRRALYGQNEKKPYSPDTPAPAETAEPATEPTPIPTVQPTPVVLPQSKFQKALETTYRNLLQVIIRYGERPLYTLSDGSTISVGDYILEQLRADQIQAPTPLYHRIIEEFAAHQNDEGFQSSEFFKFHTDPEVSALAIDLIADKYQLSSMFSKQSISENVTQTVKVNTEEEQLPTLIPRMLLELKYTILEQRIDEMERALREAERSGNWEMQRILLADQPKLLEIRNQICRQLGNRVITT
ncbi:MAG: DNA primase [Paludibacteraceae bacterium]|nr:DNA primase [Paludibacteraceae bacterium]